MKRTPEDIVSRWRSGVSPYARALELRDVPFGAIVEGPDLPSANATPTSIATTVFAIE